MKHPISLYSLLAGALLAPGVLFASCHDYPPVPTGPYQANCGSYYHDDRLIGYCPISGTKLPPDPNTIIGGFSCGQLEKAQVSNVHANLWARTIVPEGSWVKTCVDSRYYYNGLHPEQSHLEAFCLTNDGHNQSAQIDASPKDTIVNNNGHLEKQ